MNHRVVAPEVCDAERGTPEDRTRSLSGHGVAVRERALEHGNDRVDVVRRLRPDVFRDERERLRDASPDVELGCVAFVEDRRDVGEG